MKIFRSIQEFINKAELSSRPVLTIGNFDGVHLGHRRLFEILSLKAKECGSQSIALTFKPHPQAALFPEKKIPLLLDYEVKLQKILAAGVDSVIEEPFSREFSSQSPDLFLQNLLVDQLKIQALIVGYDFAFGKSRVGGLDLIRDVCKKNNIDLTVVEALQVEGLPVSSSRIREQLALNQIESANGLLGYTFSYQGTVTKGEQRGRRIGFPTANLKIDTGLNSKIILPFGVYATQIKFWKKNYPSVTNIGIRPTFYKDHPEPPVLIETYVLDQTLDLYGVEVEVEFLKFIRSEHKFASAKELTDQIAHDIDAARGALS